MKESLQGPSWPHQKKKKKKSCPAGQYRTPESGGPIRLSADRTDQVHAHDKPLDEGSDR